MWNQWERMNLALPRHLPGLDNLGLGGGRRGAGITFSEVKGRKVLCEGVTGMGSSIGSNLH